MLEGGAEKLALKEWKMRVENLIPMIVLLWLTVN